MISQTNEKEEETPPENKIEENLKSWFFQSTWDNYPTSCHYYRNINPKTCARKGVYDQTVTIRNRPLIKPYPDRSNLWSYHPQTESDPWLDHSHPKLTFDPTTPIRKWPLIIPFPSTSDFWSYHFHPKVTSDHSLPRPKVISDHTIPIRKWPLIIPFLSESDPWWYHAYHPQTESDPWSYHSHPEFTSDHTFPIWNQNPDPVILVWEHVCVGLGMIRGHFRMAPQHEKPRLYQITDCEGLNKDFILNRRWKSRAPLFFLWGRSNCKSKISTDSRTQLLTLFSCIFCQYLAILNPTLCHDLPSLKNIQISRLFVKNATKLSEIAGIIKKMSGHYIINC